MNKKRKQAKRKNKKQPTKTGKQKVKDMRIKLDPNVLQKFKFNFSKNQGMKNDRLNQKLDQLNTRLDMLSQKIINKNKTKND